jgi:hypothetical protein
LELKEIEMKKLFLIFSAVGLLTACNSNKKSTSYSSQGPSAQETPKVSDANNVNRINEEGVAAPAKSKSHVDSLMQNSGASERRYNHLEANFKGASGAGTGGSYAGSGYAQSRYKRKQKPKVKRIFDAPMVEEARVNKTNEAPVLNTNDSTSVSKEDTTNTDPALNNELTDFNEINDSTSTSKGDSTKLNPGW